ncbi:MAG: bifunctional 2-C-methyl-D-erythritol 4-phosphate cytidylyltransferase/2-C-methyl-D-erythritol 2,4-cyclodiphosphate synthase [Sphingorhabdus sp.]
MTSSGKIAAIIVAAGSGSRAGEGVPKQFRLLDGKPMLRHSLDAFAAHPAIDCVVVVVAEGQQGQASAVIGETRDTLVVTGGETRRESVRNGLKQLQILQGFDRALIHDAARPFLPAKIIDDLISALAIDAGAVPALPVTDSLARSHDGAILSASENRDGLWRIQTPQAFDLAAICAAHDGWDSAQEATDDARMAMAAGYSVAIIPGDERLAKYTFASDFREQPAQNAAMQIFRTGTGFDVHRLVENEDLWLCGIKVPHDKGLSGHSDADVALHALTDAILGAAALGDIGDHFPPSDLQWRGAASDRFLAYAASIVTAKGYAICNVDVTIICEAPKIGPHRAKMRERVSDILQIPIDAVSIKATTTERLGYTGRGEGIAAQAVATLMKEQGHAA